jgi:diguanylate cyclase (GGDEF)-like protein
MIACNVNQITLYPSLILVIDDDLFIQKQLKLYLEKAGHEVIAACNGQEGLSLYQSQRPDLVLLDALMPDMDGFECCHRLMQYPQAEYTPILMITGLEDQASVDRAFEVGATDYVTKPIHWAVLRQRVKRLIYQARLQKQLEAANRLLEEIAWMDGLTQISNRRYFDDCLEKEWQRGLREQQPLSLILCDVDYFKLYNDYYGHQAGDRCLQQIAKTLKSQGQRPTDLAARYGGEEFVILLPHTDSYGGQKVAAWIQKAIAALQIPHAQSQVSEQVTLSLGLATLIPKNYLSTNVLIERADSALYAAKRGGRDRLSIFVEESISWRNGHQLHSY